MLYILCSNAFISQQAHTVLRRKSHPCCDKNGITAIATEMEPLTGFEEEVTIIQIRNNLKNNNG